MTGDGIVETVTTVTGDTATLEETVATGARSATTVAAMEAEGDGVVMDSGLVVIVRDGVLDGAWVGEAEAAAVLGVVLTLLVLAAAVTPTLTPDPEAPATRRGLSSDCWMIFTLSGFDHADSRVLAL